MHRYKYHNPSTVYKHSRKQNTIICRVPFY